VSNIINFPGSSESPVRQQKTVESAERSSDTKHSAPAASAIRCAPLQPGRHRCDDRGETPQGRTARGQLPFRREGVAPPGR
jgi:hypothetical protein